LLKERVLEELKPDIPDEAKTKRMLILEKRLGHPIEYIIRPQERLPSAKLAGLIGISESLLSKWRKRFNIEDVRVVPRGRRKNNV